MNKRAILLQIEALRRGLDVIEEQVREGDGGNDPEECQHLRAEVTTGFGHKGPRELRCPDCGAEFVEEVAGGTSNSTKAITG